MADETPIPEREQSHGERIEARLLAIEEHLGLGAFKKGKGKGKDKGKADEAAATDTEEDK